MVATSMVGACSSSDRELGTLLALGSSLSRLLTFPVQAFHLVSVLEQQVALV